MGRCSTIDCFCKPNANEHHALVAGGGRGMNLEERMNLALGTSLYLLGCVLIFPSRPYPLVSPFPTAADTGAQQSGAERDGQRDFDFELGSWKIHLKRLVHPLTGSTTWIEFDGTSVTRKVWDGRAELEEFETDGQAGHIEGLTLRLYNPQ